ncbi:efflux RND transporter permease subunit [Halorussus caseinilyticus]|uniref:efflux RND transporter permease subunit n=1 Tax=Halorussus caseinilyticus TaxID=3034025 RepID=UPI0023E8E420|nr:MMPL family transporter [Halorussus sp. DT72]
MKPRLASRYADALVSHSTLVVALVLVLTAVVGAGAVVGTDATGGTGDAGIDSPEQAALDSIDSTYETDDAVVAQIVVRDEGGDVLTRESLLRSLRLQQAMRENETVNSTLRANAGIVGVENIVATAAYFEDRPPAGGANDTASVGPSAGRPTPTLDRQIAALESRSPAEVQALLARVLDSETTRSGPNPAAFLPSDYEPGTTSADARLTLVFQTDGGGDSGEPQDAYDAQIAVASLVEGQFEDAFVFGQGIVDEASSQAIGDSFLVITPVAVVLLVAVLTVAYRDLLDVLLSVFGVAVVMVWLAGIQGWLAISSSSILIAVPFLLVGLSIDYSLHVVMRYREARTGNDAGSGRAANAPATAMRTAISGVVVALAAAAFTTGIGFFSNYVSPLASIRDFAVLSGTGIVAMFLVFAALVPTVKLEAESFLERLGRDRRKSPVGGEAGPIRGLLESATAVSRRAPLAVVFAALVVSSAGAYGATGLDTEFNRADFLPEDAPEWMESLPEPFAPGEYDVRENFEYVTDTFRQRGQGSQAQILIRGDVTAPSLLTAIERTDRNVDETGTIALDADGTGAIESPATVLRSVAAENRTVARAIEARDSDGDGLPDEDVGAVYDALFEAAPEQASSVLHRTDDGSYASARLVVGVETEASAQSIASDVRTAAASVEESAPVTAVATGGPVVTAVVQSALFETLVEGFAVTLGVILAFLAGVYWWRYRAPELAAVMLLPVVLSLAWLLGAMAMLDIPFNSETVVITSLAIGLGVDYSVHLGERFVDERRRGDSLADALSAAITGTGGALLGSAMTTAAGFGVLSLALSPPLRRFGLVTGLSIVFAFVACVTVLPSLLVIRERLGRRREGGESV